MLCKRRPPFVLGFDGKPAGSAPQSLSCLLYRFLFARKKKEDDTREPQKVPAAEEREYGPRSALSVETRKITGSARACASSAPRISRISRVKVTEIPAGQTKLGAR